MFEKLRRKERHESIENQPNSTVGSESTDYISPNHEFIVEAVRKAKEHDLCLRAGDPNSLYPDSFNPSVFAHRACNIWQADFRDSVTVGSQASDELITLEHPDYIATVEQMLEIVDRQSKTPH